MTARLLALLTLAACGWLVSCTDVHWVPATQVIVSVHSDLGAGLASLDANIYDVRGDRRGGSWSFDLQQNALPLSFSVIPKEDSTRQFLVVLSGRDADGNELVATKAIANFVRQQTVGIDLWLYEDCAGSSCQPDQTCTAKSSSTVGCTEVPMLTGRPVIPGSELDAGLAEPLDATTTGDAEPATTRDAGGGHADSGLDAGTDIELSDARVATDASSTDVSDASGGSDAEGGALDPCFGNASQAVCVDQVLHLCDAQGTTLSRDSCASAQQCQLGIAGRACPLCSPGTYRCTDTQLERCSDNGLSWQLKKICESAALCNATAGDCTASACTAATKVCMSDELYGCSADLTQLVSLKTCDAGMCDQARGQCDVCLPNTTVCNGDSVQSCDAQGKSLTISPCPAAKPKCTGSGQCVQCLSTADCGAPSNQCKNAICAGNPPTCGSINKSAHKTCSGGVCDGSGNCVGCIDNTDCKTGYECNGSTKTCQKVSIAGTGTSCLLLANSTGGRCGSFYCGVTPSQFSAAFDAASVCGSAPSLMCAGSVYAVTTKCAPMFATEATAQARADILACVKSDPAVASSNASDACVGCFVDVWSCCQADINCLTSCLLNAGKKQCDDAQKAAGCISPLFTCGGLPNPL